MAFAIVACHEDDDRPDFSLELSQLSALRDSSLQVDDSAIRSRIARLMRADKDSAFSDFQARAYYAARRPYLWIDRLGTDSRADSLQSFLADVRKMGFSEERFRVGQIASDLQRLRSLDFSGEGNDVNSVLARLEYHLTKAYMNYAAGQGFGFVNPRKVLNHFDVKDSDSLHVEYHRLYDVPLRTADKSFYEQAVRKVAADSVGPFLRSLQPRHPFYHRLLAMLADSSTPAADRPKILCNLERCRWRLDDQPYEHKKYVLVNIPSYRLYAVDGDSVMSMRVGCGTFKTKTPLITSRISRMDINPQWVIPRSIIEKDIVRHVGDRSYFERRHYFVRNRRTGKNVDLEKVTWSMLMDKNYLVIQEGGAGNSLGRIIFRFENNFSVFLHDTSSPAFFSRDDRGVSHGCVRVQNPFDLAVFLLQDKDDKLIDRINYSMHADVSRLGSNNRRPPSADDEEGFVELPDTLDRSRLISSHHLNPEVPLFLTYYTLFEDPRGELHRCADVYGYDRVIYANLKTYLNQ